MLRFHCNRSLFTQLFIVILLLELRIRFSPKPLWVMWLLIISGRSYGFNGDSERRGFTWQVLCTTNIFARRLLRWSCWNVFFFLQISFHIDDGILSLRLLSQDYELDSHNIHVIYVTCLDDWWDQQSLINIQTGYPV